MSILNLRTNHLMLSRLTAVGGSKMAFATVTGVDGTLQPVSVEEASLMDGVYGRSFQFFCDGAIDIQEGDKLKDNTTGFVYRVKAGAVVRRTYNAIDFLKVICERIKD